MEKELQDYLDHHFENIYDGINGLRENVRSVATRMDEHASRESGRDIHHIPPCSAFEGHLDEIKTEKREDRRNTIAIAALVAAVMGLLVKLIFKI